MASNAAVDTFLAQQLNPAQKAAVVARDGPLLILAGAGSGKTRVIAYRIAYLVMEREVQPAQILAVTFTNKAATEMKGRVEGLIGAQARAGDDGHLSQRLRPSAPALRLARGVRIVVLDLRRRRPALGDQALLRRRRNRPQAVAAAAVRSAISRAKEELLTPLAVRPPGRRAVRDRRLHRLPPLPGSLQEQNALDFDDLLVLTLRLFEAAPDVLSTLQTGYRHVLVDEFQDVNRPSTCWSRPSPRSTAT